MTSSRVGALECTSTASQPASAYAAHRRSASSTPSPLISASVRAMRKKSSVRWAVLATVSLRLNSGVGSSACSPPAKLFIFG